ncbi:unnamed protein product, partial [Amoebophrya sp. A120]
ERLEEDFFGYWETPELVEDDEGEEDAGGDSSSDDDVDGGEQPTKQTQKSAISAVRQEIMIKDQPPLAGSKEHVDAYKDVLEAAKKAGDTGMRDMALRKIRTLER